MPPNRHGDYCIFITRGQERQQNANAERLFRYIAPHILLLQGWVVHFRKIYSAPGEHPTSVHIAKFKESQEVSAIEFSEQRNIPGYSCKNSGRGATLPNDISLAR